jgi:hypothetical protein
MALLPIKKEQSPSFLRLGSYLLETKRGTKPSAFLNQVYSQSGGWSLEFLAWRLELWKKHSALFFALLK